jgi:hypothetical protein
MVFENLSPEVRGIMESAMMRGFFYDHRMENKVEGNAEAFYQPSV